MSWYIFGGIVLLIGLVLLIYYFRNDILQEGFQTIENVVMCNKPENANTGPCAKPDSVLVDDPGPESSKEIDLFDNFEKKNISPLPPFKQTYQTKFDKSSQIGKDDFPDGLPWDYDNIDSDPNVVLWGFVHPLCTQEIFLNAKIAEKYGSINNFEYSPEDKIYTYEIPLFENMSIGPDKNLQAFKFAEFISNFALGIVVETIWNRAWEMTGIDRTIHNTALRSESSFIRNTAMNVRSAQLYKSLINDVSWSDWLSGKKQSKIEAAKLRVEIFHKNMGKVLSNTALNKAGKDSAIRDLERIARESYNTRAPDEPSKEIRSALGNVKTSARTTKVPLTSSELKAAGRTLPKALVQSIKKSMQKIAQQLGIKLAEKLAVSAAQSAILPALGPAGWTLFAFEMSWIIVMIIIIPAIMAEYIPADALCPPGYPYNAMNNVREGCGYACWEVVVNIPFIGDLLNAFGPYVCHSPSGDAKVKKSYETPLYYLDSSLSIFGRTNKPMIPTSDPAYTDKRKYYELEGYDFDRVNGISSMSLYLKKLETSADLNKNTKAPPPVWVDFSDPQMLNKMAQYYYNTSRRLPYTNYDGTISFEWISKIYGVVSSSQYTCDLQCEITIDTIYPHTGILKSRIISPPDELGNTYHDRRFYFFVDKDDHLLNETINGTKITYRYQSATSQFGSVGLPIRNGSLYSNASTDWEALMADNRDRFIITGCTCANYTAPLASDSPSSGYAGDALISVADPNSIFFQPTLNIPYDPNANIPDDQACNIARSRNLNTKQDSAPTRSSNVIGGGSSGQSIIYDGLLCGNTLYNKTGPNRFELTLTLSADKTLTFQETLPILYTPTNSYSIGTSRAGGSVEQIALNDPVRIRAKNGAQNISFDAAIDSVNTSSFTLKNIRNIKGNFNISGPTMLTNGILLKATKWGSNTKIWVERPPVPKSDRARGLGIAQSLLFGTIAQAPGLGLQYQFAGSLLVTGLDAGGVTNQLACTYQDIRNQPGTYIINGNIFTSDTHNDENNYLIERGPTIDYSPGYTPRISKTSNLQLQQTQCIDRYNIRWAINRYQKANLQRRITRIFKIRTMPDTNTCVYDIEQTGFISGDNRDFDIPDKFISFGIKYKITSDTSTYIPDVGQGIVTNPPLYDTPLMESVDPTKKGYFGLGSANTSIQRVGCARNITCGSYRQRRRLYDQFNLKYSGNPSIDPDTINKTKIGESNPVNIFASSTITINSSFSADTQQILLFEEKTTSPFKYRFEGMYGSNIGNNRIITNIDVIFPYIEKISVNIPIQLNGYNPIDITLNNLIWLYSGMNIHMTFNTGKQFNALALSYTNNILEFRPYEFYTDSSVQISSIIIRHNELATLSGSTFTITDAQWIKVGMSIYLTKKATTTTEYPTAVITSITNISVSDNITTFTISASITGDGDYFVRLNEDNSLKSYDIYTINATSYQNNIYNAYECTYETDIIMSDVETDGTISKRTISNKSISFILKETPISNDPSKCMYDMLYDNTPTAVYYPFVPLIGNFIDLPAPIPPPGLLGAICEGAGEVNNGANTAYRDCSGIDIVMRLVDKYNRDNSDSKILKVLRAYPLTNKCEYQVEISRKIPNSRDRIIKKEALRFNMVADGCKYTYSGEPTTGTILMINEPDPYSGTPDTFALNPPYMWPTSIVDRYRRFVNQAITMYQSMTPTWGSILDDVSQTSENRMKGIFNEIYANRSMGDCNNLTCRDTDTLTKIITQYNYENYPSYTAIEQYGYTQRSIVEIRRGGLGGTFTQCHIELIEQQDYYEDYTMPPVQSDDPSKARFNTKYFLRQYQFDLEIRNCSVSRVFITRDQIQKNIMDISSNPFGIQSDVSIVKLKPTTDLFSLDKFYDRAFLDNIAQIYNNKIVNVNAPPQYQKNRLTKFINAFIVSPTICEYQIQITRNTWSDEYEFWTPIPNKDSYISVFTNQSYDQRNITDIKEIILTDINFQLEGDNYIPRDKNRNILQLPYIFYADLTNTTSRIKGFLSNGATKVPNTDTSGYTPT